MACRAVLSWLWSLLRGLWDALVTLVTGRSALERALDGSHSPDMTLRFEEIVLARGLLSRTQLFLEGDAARDPDDVASVAKEILRRVAPSRTHSERSIANAAECLRATRSLGALVRELREATAPYDPAKPEHETLLEDLWSALRPDVRRRARISAEWGEIGFQGQDPATDFRGMGLLGLRNLVAFASGRPALARGILEDSTLRKNHFSFAITGLNLTYVLFDLTVKHRLNALFYALGPNMGAFQRVYDAVFVQFNARYKAANPPTVMEFQSIFRPFVEALPSTLSPRAVAAAAGGAVP